MNPSFQKFKESLIEKLLEFLWRQWSALGVAGHVRSDDDRMIDPEALLLFSSHIARYDSRLFDEILDWLLRNGHWINLHRLGTLHRMDRVGDSSVMAAIADYLSRESAHQKWNLMMRRIGQPVAGYPQEHERLFPSVPVLREPDPLFLSHGLERGRIELRGMSQSPRPDQPSTFLFKLRALFGMQSRAEVMAWLLANEHGHPAEIARDTGYLRRSIQNVLNDLSASGHVGFVRIGREKNFSILRHDDWRFLLTWPDADVFPSWFNWAPLFHAMTIFLETLAKPGVDDRSANFQAVQLREAVVKATPALARAGCIHRMQSVRDMSAAGFIAAVFSDLESLIP
jgi:hypothetical protein